MFVTSKEFLTKSLVRKPTGPAYKKLKLSDDLPIAPIYHYFNKNDNSGPIPNDLMVNALTTHDDNLVLYINHVTELNGLSSEYLKDKLRTESGLIRDYHRTYRQFSRVFKLDKVLSRKTPVILNYNLINKLYPIKTRKPDTNLDIGNLHWELILKTASELDTKRTQFIPLSIPRTLREEDYYLDLLKNNKLTDLRKIKSEEDMVILDVLGYYSGYNKDSRLGKYIDNLSNVVLSIVDSNNVTYISLGDLREWSNDSDNESIKLKWLYSLMNDLVQMRPVVDLEISETYADKLVAVADEESKVLKGDHKDSTSTLVETKDYASMILPEADALLTSGAITQAEYKGNLTLANKYKRIPNPYGDGSLADLVTGVPKISDDLDLNTVPELKTIKDPSFLDNTVKNLDKTYIRKHAKQDLVDTTMSLQNGGLIITNYKSKKLVDVANKIERISVQTKPVKGDLATFNMDIPIISDDGTFLMGGVTYRMNKQRSDLPIVKIAPDTVGLNSAMSKMFVRKGTRKTNNYTEWVINKVIAQYDLEIIKLEFGDVSNYDLKLKIPNIYGLMSKRFKTLTLGKLKLNFDYNNRLTLAKDLKVDESNGVLVGTNGNALVYVDDSGEFVSVSSSKEIEVLGQIEDIIKLEDYKRPLDYAEVKIKGKVIPVGVLLAYWLGFETLLKYLDIKYVELGRNARVEDDLGFTILFSDVKINCELETPLQKLIVHGFGYFDKVLRTTKMDELATSDGYYNALSSRGLGSSQILEFNLIRNMWIDPITRKILLRIKEPTDMVDLFIRATELLTNHQYVDENDGDYKIEKGYSRVNDIIYRELLVGMRELNRGSKTAKRTFSINPKAVKLSVLKDAGISPSESTNPVQQMSEQERITYSGGGGRSDRSMVAKHRKFHKNDVGTISEGFTDSGKAGTILFYTNKPNIGSVYGTKGTSTEKGLGNLTSPTMALGPFLDLDD